ncbi:MAG: M81 family metallopeptidase [Lachnospiraceae bacterium]|nr:M81 family metallopeptidase [Lachnospiraceae bacterium]
MAKRVLVCGFHQESNTFNPVTCSMYRFSSGPVKEGQEAYEALKAVRLDASGMIEAIEEAGGEVVMSLALRAGSGGRVADEVYEYFVKKVREYMEKEGPFDAIGVSLHGATCTESLDDPCGLFLEELRKWTGPDVPVAASFDLHANITDRILRSADIVCGYQCYPHVDIFRTGWRAGHLLMRLAAGGKLYMAASALPMMTPPSGYTTRTGPFKEVSDLGHAFVEDGALVDYTVFNVQPWLDIPDIQSRVIAISSDPENALEKAELLAAKLWEVKDRCWPELMTIDEAIDRAENPGSRKPVLLVDASDSPNGGAVGDSVAVALRLWERKSPLRAGMFVADPAAVRKAFSLGVGAKADFSVGAGFTPGAPGPLRAEARVVSLHDGLMPLGGGKNRRVADVGRAAVLRIGPMDIMVCEKPTASGDPQILRHFGIEPAFLDLVVVKANTSFLEPYSAFSGDILYADTPGAGSANLRSLTWKRLPRPMYPFDNSPNLRPGKAFLTKESV